MSRAVSTPTGRSYGVVRVAREWGGARSTVYDRRRQAAATPAKRGLKTADSDAQLSGHIRHVIANAPSTGEGHRKVWAQLRFEQGVRTGRPRVLRLMREGGRLAPQRPGTAHGLYPHAGTIVTDAPDEMWGTDATCTTTPAEAR